VLRNGAVVPVRDEIAALVGGGRPDVRGAVRGTEVGESAAPAPDGEAVRAARLRRFAR
jgi:hypothetical protein